MSGASPQAGGQAPIDPQSPGGTPPQTTPQEGAGEQRAYKTLEEAQAAIARLERELERTNREAASHRVENKTLKQAQEESERAKRSELENAQRDAAKHQQEALEARQKLQELTVRMAIKDKAAGMGFNDPEDAFLLLMRGGDLEYDDDGTPKNAEKLLKALAESKPYLLKAQGSPSGIPNVMPANGARSAQTQKPAFDPKNPPRLGDSSLWKR